jgi:hypothetical protein
MGLPVEAAGVRVFELYRAHARQVNRVIEDGIAEHRRAIRRRALPANCLLRLAYHDGAAGEPGRPGGNYFVRRGNGWLIRFGGGGERFYTPERGFEYLRILLGCPGRTFTASELAARVQQCGAANLPRAVAAGEAAAAGITADTPGRTPALDDEAREALLSRLREIRERRPLVEADGSPAAVDELDEMDTQERAIRQRLGRDCRLDGRARELGDVRDRVRNSVCNAVRRALKQVGEYDKPLLEHLKRPVLNLGHALSYVPRSEVTWAMED